MQFKPAIQNYVRSSAPSLPQSQPVWLQEELKKIERTLATVTEALAQIAAKVT